MPPMPIPQPEAGPLSPDQLGAQALSEATSAMMAANAMNTQQSIYDEWLAEFQGVPLSPMQTLIAYHGTPNVLFHEMDPKKLSTEQFVKTVSPTGKILYKNGVIADPVSGQVQYPANTAIAKNIRGSEPWLHAIQKDWSEKKANEWRKKLIAWGYEPEGGLAPNGGVALDLISALRLYHGQVYINYGDPIKARPGGVNAKRQVKQSVDMAGLRMNAKRLYQTLDLGDPSDAEAEQIADFVVDQAIEMVRSGIPVAQAVRRASSEQTESIMESPVGEEAQRIQVEQETSDKLRSKMVNISQIAGL